jgi:hypothetical protein
LLGGVGWFGVSFPFDEVILEPSPLPSFGTFDATPLLGAQMAVELVGLSFAPSTAHAGSPNRAAIEAAAQYTGRTLG